MKHKSTNDDLLKIEKLEKEKASLHSQLELMRIVSYEFRTSIGPIMSAYDELQSTKLSLKQQQSVNFLGESSKHLLKFVNDFIDFMQQETGETKLEILPFDIQGCLTDVHNSLQEQAKQKKIDLSYSVIPDMLVSVNGDQKKLKQVLNHVIENAIKFTEKGQIHASLSITKLDPHQEKVENSILAKFLVTDTGVGVPKEQLEILQAFFKQTKPLEIPSNVCGLGFTLCKYLCDLLSGTITINSKIGQGSEIEIIVPFEPC